MLTHPRPCSPPRALVVILVALAVLVMPDGAHASTVSGGCAHTSGATESKGFFTLFGSTASDANGCFVMLYDDRNADNNCDTACAAGGLTCTPKGAGERATLADCTAALDWYLSSSAKATSITSSPGQGPQDYCTVDDLTGTWTRADKEFGMPVNDHLGCDNFLVGSSGPTEAVVPCKCNDPPDTTAPTVSSTSAVQAPGPSVTVTGNVDEAATVYCNVAASGASHTPTNVKAAGFSDAVGAAGSFTVTVTGVSGDGTKSVACVGEDGSSNLGSTSVGADFQFGTAVLLAPCCVRHGMCTSRRAVATYHQMAPPPP